MMEAIDKHLSYREDFSIETLYSGAMGPDVVKRADRDGYYIECIFIGTNDVDVNINRVEQRSIAHAGADVPVVVIEKAWSKSKDNLKETAHLLDKINIYDSTGTKPIKRATIARNQQGTRDPEAPAWVKELVDDINRRRGNVFDNSKGR